MESFRVSLPGDSLVTTGVHGTACLTCRRRKRSCDRKLPSCDACASRGLFCEGYVLRWAGHGNDTLPRPRRTQARVPKPVSGVSSGGDNLGDGIDSTAAIALLTESTRDYDIGPVGFPDGLGHLVNFDARQLGPLFFQARSPQENPYFLNITQLARSVAPIRFALASSASYHLASIAQAPHLIVQSFRLRGHATRLLRERLQENQPQDKRGSLAAMLVLAQLDMCSGHCTEFDIHLHAARDLMRLEHKQLAPHDFVEQRLLWLDLMSSTTSSRRPAFDLDETIGYLTSARREQFPSHVFPCTCEIFLILASAIHYHKSGIHPDENLSDIRRKSDDYCGALRQCAVSPSASQRERSLTECYRNGALLLVNGLFNRPSRTEEAPGLVAVILDHVQALLDVDPHQNFLLWPLYQAGLDCQQDSEAAKRIEQYFRTRTSSSGCSHGANGLTSLRAYWASGGCKDRTPPPPTSLEGQLTLV